MRSQISQNKINRCKDSININEVEENLLLKHLILCFKKITDLGTDEELFEKFLNSNFVSNCLRLISFNSDCDITDCNKNKNSNINLISHIQVINPFNMQVKLIFRIIGHLIGSPNNEHTNVILNCNFIQITESILKYYYNNNNGDYDLLKEAAFSISNVTGGTESQADTVILNSNIADYFLFFSKDTNNPKFLNEVIYIFYNAYDYGSDDCKKNIANNQNLMNLVISLLQNQVTLGVTELCLDFLKLIFEKTKKYLDMNLYYFIKQQFDDKNLPNILEQISFNKNKDIGMLAYSILTDNWSLEEQYFS